MPNLVEVIKTLPTLSIEELQQLQTRANFLLEHNQIEQSPSCDFELDFFKAFQHALDDAYGIRTPGIAQLKRLGLYKKYKEAINELVPFFQSIEGTKVERHASYLFFTKLVIEHLTDNKVLVSVKTVIQNLNKIPELFDKAFPGYIKAGILPWMINTLTKN